MQDKDESVRRERRSVRKERICGLDGAVDGDYRLYREWDREMDRTETAVNALLLYSAFVVSDESNPHDSKAAVNINIE